MRSRTRKKSESEFSRRKRRISVVRQPDEKRGSQAAGDHEHVGPEHQPHHALFPACPAGKRSAAWSGTWPGMAPGVRSLAALLVFAVSVGLAGLWRWLADARRRGAEEAGGGDRVAGRRGRAPCRGCVRGGHHEPVRPGPCRGAREERRDRSCHAGTGRSETGRGPLGADQLRSRPRSRRCASNWRSWRNHPPPVKRRRIRDRLEFEAEKARRLAESL